MLETRPSCNFCNVAFALAEEYVWSDKHPYHEHCLQRLERKQRLQELILTHAVNHGLVVVPHHPNGR